MPLSYRKISFESKSGNTFFLKDCGAAGQGSRHLACHARVRAVPRPAKRAKLKKPAGFFRVFEKECIPRFFNYLKYSGAFADIQSRSWRITYTPPTVFVTEPFSIMTV